MSLYARQSQGPNCIPCGEPASCNCAPGEQCILINRDCNTCYVNKCLPPSKSSNKGGISGGAVGGAVVAAIAFLAVAVLAFFWFRRRSRRARAQASVGDNVKPEPVARAEDVLNRPDPNEKPPTPAPMTPTIHGTQPYGDTFTVRDGQTSTVAGTHGHASQRSRASNPFEDRLLDNHSIQTAGSVGTDVIPIALVGPDGASTVQSTHATAGSVPARPDRDPRLDISLDPNGDSTNLPPPNLRHSYMSTGSYASDLLSEAPIIVTPGRGAVKQVLGVVKAEVIRTPGASDSANGLRPSPSLRQPARSPLAVASFGPSDVAEQSQEVDVKQNPFGDEHSPYLNSQSPNTVATFGSAAPVTPSQYSAQPTGTTSQYSQPTGTTNQYSAQTLSSDWISEDPISSKPRPDSVYTQAASVIGASIGSATRMHLGHVLATPTTLSPDTPVSASLSTPRTPYRMTSAKLVSNLRSSPVSPGDGAFEMQQRRAMQDMDSGRRASGTSVMTSASQADTILESFPFVPPSPISDRPLRTPPRSPLAQQEFAERNNVAPPSPPSPTQQPESRNQLDVPEINSQEGQLPRKKAGSQAPPTAFNSNRKMLGMSIQSQTSTMSNGLGSFPFQIDTASIAESVGNSPPPQNVNGRQRASLDTLALTSDLSSYPLSMDQNMMDHYPGVKR
ncbi:hypothetical protein BXZ70DRAFT_950955 [Cristinia sonorae]|uniref:Membrane anchor Opy2 N-terminal domain-containing protein n=1 Tax=Cristinia sonorae TaxID=1940300 RepID=A0A8K0UHM7_9AGAR|nr:hypothetical protein BXZ70DRAFT_950955 [Cristinia sonorae]